MPKISIDPGIEIFDSHSGKSPEHWLPLVRSKRNSRLAFQAAQTILEDIVDVASHVEVIKISFYWNINLGDKQRICADAVLVEPSTNNKKRVGVNSGIYLQYPEGDGIDVGHREAIRTLSVNLMGAIRWQILEFRKARRQNEKVLQKFDDLLSDVEPIPAMKKEYCRPGD